MEEHAITSLPHGQPPSSLAQPNIYDAACPSRHVLSRIADKWSVMVLGLLQKEALRFGALKRGCAGVSQKMLTQTLRHLEQDGLVTRSVVQSKPLQVEYALTPLGASLVQLVQPLVNWVHAHYPEMAQAQARQRLAL